MLMEECAEWHHTTYYCPNWVEEKFFTQSKPMRMDAPITFSYVGKRVVEKGLDDILLPAAQVAGVRLRALAKDWRDAVTPARVREHYQACDVQLVCSTIDGTPNPALEAASCGLALLSNRIGNMPEFIAHGTNGVLVDRVWEQYANAMSMMAKEPEATRAMGRVARKTVLQDWTWDIRAQAYDKMLKEVLA
mgnify:CR=1 FL=1